MLKTLTPWQTLIWRGLQPDEVNLYGRGGELLRDFEVMRFGIVGERVQEAK
jgi:hypothetical protein